MNVSIITVNEGSDDVAIGYGTYALGVSFGTGKNTFSFSLQ